MERQKQLEEQFKRRYNRTIKCFVEKEVDGNFLKKATIDIRFKGKTYTLIETLEKNKTKEVFVEVGNRTYKYSNYLEAEVFVADLIGDIEEG